MKSSVCFSSLCINALSGNEAGFMTLESKEENSFTLQFEYAKVVSSGTLRHFQYRGFFLLSEQVHKENIYSRICKYF